MFEHDSTGFLSIGSMKRIAEAANTLLARCRESEETVTFWHWYLVRDDTFGLEMRKNGRMGRVKVSLPTPLKSDRRDENGFPQ